MAPPATGAARRTAAAPQHRPAPRRAPLRIFEPEPRRAPRRGRSRRTHIWLAVGLVVGSLLVVVVGDAMVAQGQVRMADMQAAIAADQISQKSMQVQVAELSAAPRVVAVAKGLGLTAPASVLDLPQVPLNVPLPVPQTAPSGSAATHPTTATTPATTAR